MKLQNKKIAILTDFKSENYTVLRSIIESQGGTCCIRYTGDVGPDCFADSNVIVFDVKEPLEKIKEMRSKHESFASILYIRQPISEFAKGDYEERILSKFDRSINSPGIRDCMEEPLKCNFYRNYVTQRLLVAEKVHEFRIRETLEMIRKFVEAMKKYRKSYVMLSVVDGFGTIIAIDGSGVELLGKDVVGMNIKDIVLSTTGKESFPSEEGDIVSLNGQNGKPVSLRLLSSWKVENGTTYYLKVWEVVEEVKKMYETIRVLENIEKRLDSIGEKKEDK